MIKPDRYRHIMKDALKQTSYCGISLYKTEWLIYTPVKGDKIQKLIKDRVCKKCLDYYLGEKQR